MTPVCIALAGIPGAGKTTIALEWCKATGSHLLSRDLIKRAAFGERFDVGTEQNEAAFMMIKAALPILLCVGQSVIIDGCTFAREGLMEEIEAICSSHKLKCYPVLVQCPQSVASSRLSVPDPSAWCAVERISLHLKTT